MREVYIVGIGQTRVGELWERSLRSLAVEAIRKALADAHDPQAQGLYIGNMMASTISGQANLGALLVDWAHLGHVEGPTFEAAGASGGVALHHAFMTIAAGYADTLVAVGVEKCWEMPDAQLENPVSHMLDSDFEAMYGVTPQAQAGLLMHRYLHEYRVPAASFAPFPVIAHANAVNNPNAMYRRAISAEMYENAERINAPLNMFDVAPYADGAAAVVLMAGEALPAPLRARAVRISGSSVRTDTLALHDRPAPLAFDAVRLSTEDALHQAGMTHSQVNLFELYDAYSIFAALSLEAAGFAPRGAGVLMAQAGELALTGRLPIATLGGCKARGNPLGATGMYQIVEAVQQLRGEAGASQVKNARVALTQCLGGPAATAATHVLVKL